MLLMNRLRKLPISQETGPADDEFIGLRVGILSEPRKNKDVPAADIAMYHSAELDRIGMSCEEALSIC